MTARMRVWKKILLVLAVLLVLVQIPFIYRRYQLGQVRSKIDMAAKAKFGGIADSSLDFKEYKGIIHAHTHLGGHSTGSFEEIIKAANAAELDFVLMTEHYSDEIDTSDLTLNGRFGRTLFVGGNEIDTADGDRLLMIPGSADAASMRSLPTRDVIARLHSENRLAMVTYPDRFRSWDTEFDGIEIFSLHTAAKQMSPFTAVFDLIWSFPTYPELTLARNFRRPAHELQRFDQTVGGQKVSMVAGADAHSNIGFHLFGDDTGNRLINVKLDPYETIFRVVRLHVFLDKDKTPDREAYVEAIRSGHFFIGFDVLGETTGFSFVITDGIETYRMGDEGKWKEGMKFAVDTPVPARIEIYSERGPELTDVEKRSVPGPGSYRIEVYRTDLGPPFDEVPWILSNPIYIR